MTEKRKFEFDAAGWLFWTIVFAVLVGPSIYSMKFLLYDDTPIMIFIGSGVVFAAIGAGFISWIVNAILQRRSKKRRIEEKKKARKQR